jgi:DNA-binding transcriptional ArsR family regulator
MRYRSRIATLISGLSRYPAVRGRYLTRGRYYRLKEFLHPVRLRLLILLAEKGEANISGLARAMRMHRSVAMRHLNALEAIGLVKGRLRAIRGRKRGRFYRINEEAVKLLLQDALALLMDLEGRIVGV